MQIEAVQHKLYYTSPLALLCYFCNQGNFMFLNNYFFLMLCFFGDFVYLSEEQTGETLSLEDAIEIL